MTLEVYKFGGSWVHLASLFEIGAATFQRLVDKIVIILHELVSNHLITYLAKMFHVRYMGEKGSSLSLTLRQGILLM